MPDDKIKIATITYQSADNYGAALQMFALQKKMEALNINNHIIDYKSEYMSKPYSISAFKRKGLIRYMLGLAYALVRLPRKRAFSKFRNLLLFTPKVDRHSLHKLNSEYDGFVAGSDQVWNDDINNGDPTYFLDFVDRSEKKLSYAASFGFNDIEGHRVGTYAQKLKDFAVLNVREESGRNLIDELLKRDAEVTVDPTLLLSKEEWCEYLPKDRRYREKYILLYHITFSSALVRYASKYAKANNFRLIAIPFPLGKFVPHTPQLSAGPIEWLQLLRDAEMIVTDSFHGCALSLNFNKKFVVKTTGAATRIENILQRFNLNDCLLANVISKGGYIEPDWANVNRVLQKDRKESLTILKKTLRTIKK